jgi:hypothetical protein
MFAKVFLFLALIAVAAAFAPRSAIARMAKKSSVQLSEKIKITDNVQFETIAREWRLKWSPDNDKKALSSVQQTVEVFLPQIKGVAGVKSVQRIVCGGCMDYKVVIALPASAWGKWEVRLFCSPAVRKRFLLIVFSFSHVTARGPKPSLRRRSSRRYVCLKEGPHRPTPSSLTPFAHHASTRRSSSWPR